MERNNPPIAPKIDFLSLCPWPGELVCAEGRYMEGEAEKRAAIFIGPEFGTVQRADLVAAAREAGALKFMASILRTPKPIPIWRKMTESEYLDALPAFAKYCRTLHAELEAEEETAGGQDQQTGRAEVFREESEREYQITRATYLLEWRDEEDMSGQSDMRPFCGETIASSCWSAPIALGMAPTRSHGCAKSLPGG
jgi:hypothetical protein